MAELPNRYASNGLRNWVLLNKDVAILQKHLKGSLPSRESVTKLLYEVIIDDDEEEKNFEWDYFKQTDHRMTPHKRLLAEEYAIKFPTAAKKTYQINSSPSKSPSVRTQEESDFKLALKIQQEESELIEVNSSPLHKDFLDVASTSTEDFFPVGIGYGQEIVTTNSTEENLVGTQSDIQFEADAAAALLQLQRRASK